MDETSSGTSAVAEAPAAAPVSTPSTPASPVAEKRPTSFAEAMAGIGDPAPPDPGSVPTADVPPVAASTPPQPTTPPEVTAATPDPKKGPLPYERHEAILKNAREKTTQEVTQKFQQQYAPALELGKQIQADAVGTVTQLVSELANHPDFGPQMISALARTLGSRRGQTPPSDDSEPQPDLQTADGIQVYSAPQQAKREQWFRKQIDASVDQRLGPFQQREQRQQARERLETATADAHTRMSKVLAPYAEQPEFVANKPAIAAKVTELLDAGHDAATALGVAYASVLRDTVLPSRTAQSQQTLQAEAVRKSTGSTTAPGAAPSAPATRPTSMQDAFRRITM